MLALNEIRKQDQTNAQILTWYKAAFDRSWIMTVADLDSLMKKGGKIEKVLAAADIPSQIEKNKTTAEGLRPRII